MNEAELTLYHELLREIKVRVRQAQVKAALSANAHMIAMYWDIGRLIADRQAAQGWGSKVIPHLSVDLKNELPEEKGFSERNIKRMLRFFQEYPRLEPPVATKVLRAAALSRTMASPATEIVPQPAAQSEANNQCTLASQILFHIPWMHNAVLFEKVKDPPTRFWYARQTLEQGWTRERLTSEIKSNAHLRQGTAVTNFSSTLTEVHAELATGMLKDPFIFDFLTLEEPFHERELETELMSHHNNKPPCELDEINTELKGETDLIVAMIGELSQ